LGDLGTCKKKKKNTEMNLKEIGSEGVQKIFPVQDKPLVGSCEHGNDRLDKKKMLEI
jgi:hypothetical protein